jgi:ATP diphosphatase
MSIRLVYIGAAADLAPAASLRALGGSGAVFVVVGLDAALRALVDAAVAGDPRVGAATDRVIRETSADDLDEVFAAAGPATVCIAGDDGAALARAILAHAKSAGIAVTTVPAVGFDDCLIGEELLSLRGIIAILRTRCPWDREQTAQDIVSYTVEETFELADAVAADDLAAEHGELGDLLLQVYFLAMLLGERDAGDLGSVAAAIERKLIRRHAHIFGDAVADTPAEVRGQWERIKREQEGREGVFHDVPMTLPALLLARKLQERAAAVGFDWQTAVEAFPKIAEEQTELAEVLRDAPARDGADAHEAHLKHEFGDLLFAVVNVARKAHVDPELALRQAGARFAARVGAAAELATAEGKTWSALRLAEQEEYYQRAKTALAAKPPDAAGRE